MFPFMLGFPPSPLVLDSYPYPSGFWRPPIPPQAMWLGPHYFPFPLFHAVSQSPLIFLQPIFVSRAEDRQGTSSKSPFQGRQTTTNHEPFRSPPRWNPTPPFPQQHMTTLQSRLLPNIQTHPAQREITVPEHFHSRFSDDGTSDGESQEGIDEEQSAWAESGDQESGSPFAMSTQGTSTDLRAIPPPR